MTSRGAPVKVGVALAAVAALLFGMTAPLLKQASAGVGALLSGSLVYLGAALGAGLSAAIRAQDDQHSTFSGAARFRLVAVALLGAVLAPALLIVGLRRVDGATASLLLALEAPFTIVLARLFLREFIGGRVLVAAALITVGCATLLGASIGSGGTVPGVLLVSAAMMAWSLDNVLSRPLADHDPLRVVRLKGLVGAAISGLVAVVTGEARPSLAKALALLALGAAGYGVSLQLYLRAQRVVGAARTASVFATAPFVGVAVAFLLGSPWPGAEFVVAALLIAGGVALHISERHEHLHRHESAEHEHMHRHDDGHHDHRHDPVPDGPHSHRHNHASQTHRHEHSEDIHHRHVHAAESSSPTGSREHPSEVIPTRARPAIEED